MTGSVNLWVIDVVARRRCGQREVWRPADVRRARPSGAYGPGGEEFSQGYDPARILLKTDEGWSAPKVAQALDVAEGTVFRVKRRFAEDGLDGALRDQPQAHRYRHLDDRGEAHLIALACSPAPESHGHWNLRLLADRMVELGVVESLSHETVRLHLKKRPQTVAEEAAPGSGTVGMGLDIAGVNHQPLKIRVINHRLQQSGPHAPIPPAAEAFNPPVKPGGLWVFFQSP